MHSGTLASLSPWSFNTIFYKFYFEGGGTTSFVPAEKIISHYIFPARSVVPLNANYNCIPERTTLITQNNCGH